MAAKPKGTAASAARLMAVPPQIQRLTGKAGDTLVVEVDVTEILTPYTVVFDDRTIIYGRTDRRESVPDLKPGVHRLAWSFQHAEKDWTHQIGAKVGAGAAKVLEARSEKKKDAPYSIGLALIEIV
jgi:hypothetical protein